MALRETIHRRRVTRQLGRGTGVSMTWVPKIRRIDRGGESAIEPDWRGHQVLESQLDAREVSGARTSSGRLAASEAAVSGVLHALDPWP
jgi:hypothetical protein